MKTILLSLGFLSQSTLLIAQNSSKVEEPYNYVFSKEANVYSYNYANSTYSVPPLLAGKGLVFEKVGAIRHDNTLGDIYIIQFWIVTYTPANLLSNLSINSTNTGHGEFYCIPVNDFENTVGKRYKTWRYNNAFSLGSLVMPVKMRPRKAGIPLDFTQDITLGPSLAWRFRMGHYNPSYFSIVGTFGLTAVLVDSTTTRGFVNQPTRWGSYSYGFGIMVETGKFQLAILNGWDVVGGLNGQKWIYNNRNWISIGLGLQLWKID